MAKAKPYATLRSGTGHPRHSHIHVYRTLEGLRCPSPRPPIHTHPPPRLLIVHFRQDVCSCSSCHFHSFPGDTASDRNTNYEMMKKAPGVELIDRPPIEVDKVPEYVGRLAIAPLLAAIGTLRLALTLLTQLELLVLLAC